MLTLMCIEHTSTMLPVNEIEDLYVKLKVNVKFGASEMMCVELRAQKLQNMYFSVMYVLCICEILIVMYIEHTLTLSPVNEI